MAWTGKWDGGNIWTGKDGTRTYYITRMIGGKRYSVSTRCTDERAAFRHLDRFEADPEAYIQGRDRLLLTEELAKAYTDDLEARGRSKGHLRRAKSYLADARQDLSGDLKRATVADIRRATEGRSSPGMRLAVLKAFWTWLETTGRTTTNPTRTLRVPPSRPAQWTRSKVIPTESHEKVVALLKPSYADILTVLAGTGWHISEVLRLADVRMLKDEGAHREKFLEKNPFVLVTTHKSGAFHQTLVGLRVAEAARRVLERRSKGEMFENVAAFYRAVAKACDEAGVPRFTPGRYRHTIATNAIDRGVSPEKVSAFLGHRSAATTKRFYSTHAITPKVPTLE